MGCSAEGREQQLQKIKRNILKESHRNHAAYNIIIVFKFCILKTHTYFKNEISQ